MAVVLSIGRRGPVRGGSAVGKRVLGDAHAAPRAPDSRGPLTRRRRRLVATARHARFGARSRVVQARGAAGGRFADLRARTRAASRCDPQPAGGTAHGPLDRELGGAAAVLRVRVLHQRGDGAGFAAARRVARRSTRARPGEGGARRGTRRRGPHRPSRELGHRGPRAARFRASGERRDGPGEQCDQPRVRQQGARTSGHAAGAVRHIGVCVDRSRRRAAAQRDRRDPARSRAGCGRRADAAVPGRSGAVSVRALRARATGARADRAGLRTAPRTPALPDPGWTADRRAARGARSLRSRTRDEPRPCASSRRWCATIRRSGSTSHRSGPKLQPRRAPPASSIPSAPPAPCRPELRRGTGSGEPRTRRRRAPPSRRTTTHRCRAPTR